MAVIDVWDDLKVGQWVRTNANWMTDKVVDHKTAKERGIEWLEGEVGEIYKEESYIYQNDLHGSSTEKFASVKTYKNSWVIHKDNPNELIILKGGKGMKRVWDIMVIDKTNNEVKLRETVIDGDEKSACAKVSIKFAEKLKDLVFDNLHYIAKEIGSYEEKKK